MVIYIHVLRKDRAPWINDFVKGFLAYHDISNLPLLGLKEKTIRKKPNLYIFDYETKMTTS